MSKVVALRQPKKIAPVFVLVLVKTEVSWSHIARQLESDYQQVVPSYYLIDHLDDLYQADLVRNYSACIVADCEGLSLQEHSALLSLSQQMPLIVVKQADNVSDLRWPKIEFASINSQAIGAIDLAAFIESCLLSFRYKKQQRCSERQASLNMGCRESRAVIADADYISAEHFLGGIVDSLRVVARTRGVNFDCLPIDEDLAVLLHSGDVRRHLSDLLLKIFEDFSWVRVHPSAKLSSLDHSMLFDIVARKPRVLEGPNITHSELYQQLQDTLRLNAGDLRILESGVERLRVRMEWSCAEK